MVMGNLTVSYAAIRLETGVKWKSIWSDTQKARHSHAPTVIPNTNDLPTWTATSKSNTTRAWLILVWTARRLKVSWDLFPVQVNQWWANSLPINTQYSELLTLFVIVFTERGLIWYFYYVCVMHELVTPFWVLLLPKPPGNDCSGGSSLSPLYYLMNGSISSTLLSAALLLV